MAEIFEFRIERASLKTAPGSATLATTPGLSPEMTTADGFKTIAWSCLDQLLSNSRQVLETSDPEGVHQCRVAIRRFRAAFTLFGSAVRDDRSADLKARLKDTANALGPARDLHVLIEQVTKAAEANVTETEAHDASDLLAHLDDLRREATAAAQAALAADAFQRLLLDLSGWLENGDWQKRNPAASRPLTVSAAKALSKWRRKVRHWGKHPEKKTDAELHKLRIKVKNLRYGTEFFLPMFQGSGDHNRKLTRPLSKLQDRLGVLHDRAVASTTRRALFAPLEPDQAKRLAKQMDRLIQHAPPRKRLLKAVEKHLDDVNRSPAWWKADPVNPV